MKLPYVLFHCPRCHFWVVFSRAPDSSGWILSCECFPDGAYSCGIPVLQEQRAKAAENWAEMVDSTFPDLETYD
jgi:hypothetical protein